MPGGAVPAACFALMRRDGSTGGRPLCPGGAGVYPRRMAEVVVEAHRVERDGGRRVPVAFPAGWEVRRVRASPPEGLAPGEAPPGPRSLPLPRGRVLLVVNDAHRPTPTPWLLERLDFDPLDPRVEVIVATGSHPPPTDAELHAILGPYREPLAPRTRAHRAAEDQMLALGTTSRGTPVEIGRQLLEAEAVVCLGSVEPHYFAGWTGGRKSLFPGLGSLRAIRANHRLALEPGAATGRLAGNPLHLDLVEAAQAISRRFLDGGRDEPRALNAVLCRGEVRGWRLGPAAGIVEELAPVGRAVFGRPLDALFPLVVCLVDHPLDRDLYQALKALEHWKGAVAPGGALVIAADCAGGIGPPTFTQFLESGLTLRSIERRAREAYRLGDHKLVSFLRYLDGGRSASLASAALAGAAGLPLPVRAGLEAAIAEAAGKAPPGPRAALLVEDAATVFPTSPDSAVEWPVFA